MTKEEAAIIMAFTGINLGSFSHFHVYSDKLLKRQIYTHEFSDEKVMEEIKQKSAYDFIKLHNEIIYSTYETKGY